MASNIIDVNSNILVNAEYSAHFFQYSDYELTLANGTMTNNQYSNGWARFLDAAETLELPLIEIKTFQKAQKIWFNNESLFDKMTIELDYSVENNLIEFIARKTKYRGIELDNINKLGCMVKIDYINNNGEQVIENIFVGRPKIKTNKHDKLELTLEQLNKLLLKSDFEKNVVESPTGAFYNFISLEQAFTNVYNIPHNKIDDKSYPATPFRIDETNYLPTSTKGIKFRDDNLDPSASQIYAEDYVGNTDRKIHCQFYYSKLDPSCGIKMTEYDENGNVVGTPETTNTSGWRVWSNTDSKEQELEDAGITGLRYDVLRNYSRYFRPFKVVFAGENEIQARADGNYRIQRKFVYPNFSSLEGYPVDNSMYISLSENYCFKQEKILPGNTYECELGDTLIYFEQLGDIRHDKFGAQATANILYDAHSQVFVYNLSQNIVYFDHITTFANSIPLPKQWLDMRAFIATEKMYFASRLNYLTEANREFSFFSYFTPFMAVYDTFGGRKIVASKNSLKTGQDVNGNGGNLVGEKTVIPYIFGELNMDVAEDRTTAEGYLDYIQENNKPKSIRINKDGTRIIFLKGVESEFSDWDDDWDADIVDTEDYNKVYEFPRYFIWLSKTLYMERADGTTSTNQKEFDQKRFLNWDGLSSPASVPFVNEVVDQSNPNQLCLYNEVISSYIGEPSVTIKDSFVSEISNPLANPANRIAVTNDKTLQSVNFFYYNGDYYWCNGQVIRKNLYDIHYILPLGNALDFYKDSSKERVISQTTTEIRYYDTSNDVVEYSKNITGYEYLLATDRESLIFVNPLENKSDEIYFVGEVINEPVRLLSFSGNRLVAADRLAASFFKNTYYDNDGVLNIGLNTTKKIFLDDYDIIDNSVSRTKFDTIEFLTTDIKTNGFEQKENGIASNKEEDDLEYNEAISITYTSNKDIQMDVTVTRISSTEVKWDASNEFGTETGIVIISGFDYFSLQLTGIFLGITVNCNFYNTALEQGASFRGTIKRRELVESIDLNEIVSLDNDFPFLDDNNINFKFPFVWSVNKDYFKDTLSAYFKDGLNIREQVSFTIVVPTLIVFDTQYDLFNIDTIVTLSSENKYVNGYKMNEDGTVTKYAGNLCDYFIKTMSFNKKSNTTTLTLVSV